MDEARKATRPVRERKGLTAARIPAILVGLQTRLASFWPIINYVSLTMH